ncbi:hypothetical protein P4O66_000946 [Electrophorus voltai]|uniref:GH84 domain-containing protein n=1 Tax=Electrophorus voltai TaxID=2609070 RepID=A0AAD8ZF94_9TELE|nr:hypothetical protein P4O66_000946 [Electrophorus voltai]
MEKRDEFLCGVVEAQLKALISEAEMRGLKFVYALSPGQDIVFSSSSDLTLLKRKLRQVAELGCQAFAVLFDDIDHSMCQADIEAFSSFAHAQVSVANEIFRFLGEPPVFLFCPTEYCGSLCSPSVSKSPYLLTVGEDLLPGISVIWTGSKVISRELSADSLLEVQSVLQRSPLVWDNLHANDYDSRRVFLGPFKGRPPGLRAHLRGLLLNPNCEFEANYIPLHTLGTWNQAGKGERKGRQIKPAEHKSSTASSKVKPTDSFDSHHGPQSKGPCSARALPLCSAQAKKALAGTDSGAAPLQSEDRARGAPSREKVPGKGLCAGKAPLSEAQVRLLVGLYYLPHEHGPPAQSLLQDLTWLRGNCHYVSVNGNGKKTQPQKVEEWRMRAAHFLATCDEVAALHGSVVNSVNRALLYDLYPYIWDLRNTVLVAKAFISWLEGRVMSESSSLGSWKNCFHWCGASSGAELLGLEAEPWVFKGGLSGEVQMLLPVGTSTELFCHPPPLFPTSRVYNIRPYQQKDKVELYRMLRQLHQRARSAQDSAGCHPDFVGDRYLGASLALCPEYTFVLEDELGVCGCAVGILDVRNFAKRYQASWLPALRDKYLTRPPHGANGHSASKSWLEYF